MEKHEIKSLVSQLFNDLNLQIDSEDYISKEQIVNFFRDTADIFSTNDFETIIDKKLFKNIYKDIAKDSLDSYNKTNQYLDKLNKLQIETLNQCNESTDLYGHTEQFMSIQKNMAKEIQNAHDTISNLTTQIRILERNSNIDSLTKIHNRGSLDSYLTRVCKKETKSLDMYLLMIDIDHFKNFNDTYGHVVGDKVLIFIANLLKKTLRDGDRAFRYGGEEFTIILNRINEDGCKVVLDRILNLIRKSKLSYDKNSFGVTISIGATLIQKDDTPNIFIARADKALYRAKNNGRNRAEIERLEI